MKNGVICCACSISVFSVLQFILKPWQKITTRFRRRTSHSENRERTGQPFVGSDQKTASDCYHEQFIESSFSARYSKWDDNQVWSSQEWKTDVTSWGATRKSQLSFFHEKTQHDGTAQSVVNEVILREGSGRPYVDSQRGAWPQQFVIGNDEAQSDLSVKSRSFVNRVNYHVRKKTKTILNECYRSQKNIFLVNVHDCDNGICSIHGKELPEQIANPL